MIMLTFCGFCCLRTLLDLLDNLFLLLILIHIKDRHKKPKNQQKDNNLQLHTQFSFSMMLGNFACDGMFFLLGLVGGLTN